MCPRGRGDWLTGEHVIQDRPIRAGGLCQAGGSESLSLSCLGHLPPPWRGLAQREAAGLRSGRERPVLPEHLQPAGLGKKLTGAPGRWTDTPSLGETDRYVPWGNPKSDRQIPWFLGGDRQALCSLGEPQIRWTDTSAPWGGQTDTPTPWRSPGETDRHSAPWGSPKSDGQAPPLPPARQTDTPALWGLPVYGAQITVVRQWPWEGERQGRSRTTVLEKVVGDPGKK